MPRVPRALKFRETDGVMAAVPVRLSTSLTPVAPRSKPSELPAASVRPLMAMVEVLPS